MFNPHASFANRHGEKLDTSFHPAERQDRLVILCHGVTGDKDRPLLVAVAEGLAARGWPCLRLSFAGNGHSDGDFRAATISKESNDLRDLIAQLPPSLRLAVIGHSMGGAVGVKTAAVEPRMEAVISLAGMVRCAEFCQREFGMVTPDEGVMWDLPECPLSQAYVDDLTAIGDLFPQISTLGKPLLLIHGTADDVVFPADSIDAHAHAQEPKRLILIDGAEHSFDAASYPQVIHAAAQWLEEHL
ncbi:MAG TPA: alpha/beta fold hydrolase [Luteolibacter sp.]|nr:alpha/beta fold hydrolase [Luteolibacter sp.]